MMIQHLNDVTAIARVASRIGAPLPADITSGLDHLESITAGRTGRPQPGLMAKALAAHLGDPAAMEKARKAAALELATADACAKIDAHLADVRHAAARDDEGAGRADRQQLRHALADDLATLTATAGRLPEWFNPDQAANLEPGTFTDWTLARDAYARISATTRALTPLYSTSIDQEHAAQFPIAAAHSLRFAKPPKFDDTRGAYGFRNALAGRTERVQGAAGQGSTFVDGLFVPTVLAHVGAAFEWAAPAEVGERAAVVVAGMTAHQQAPADSGTAHSFV